MADVGFQIAIAVGLQSDFDTISATIPGLSGALDETDGIVLGDRESGDFESGISAPQFVRESRAVADVPGSFTAAGDTFLRASADGLEISWHVKGNGVVSTPSASQAKPHEGIDALHEMAGLVGSAGTSPVYNYTPRKTSTVGGITKYGTVKLWIGDLAWVLKSCTVSSFRLSVQPSGIIVATAALQVGSIASLTDSVTFPTFDYGTQASLSANTVQNVTTNWGATRGWESLEIEIANSIEFAQDSAQPDGQRLIQTGRRVNVSSRLYVDSSDSDWEFQALQLSAAPTADLTFQLGAIAGAADPLNALRVDVDDLQVTSMKPSPTGEVLVAEIEGHGTGLTGGSEALIQYN